VGGIFAGVLPEPFGGIEFGRVGRELVDFQPVAVGVEPTPNLGVFMIRGVVLDEDGPGAAIVGGQLVQEVQIGASIEDGGLCIVEARLAQFDGTQDLDALAFAGDGNFRRVTDSAPGGVQGGILAEAGFVGEN
jgi:hypothetical protein